MKKSEMYIKAQGAVVCSTMHTADKLIVLRELMKQEDIERLMEEKEQAE